jgi:hypothetical protein
MSADLLSHHAGLNQWCWDNVKPLLKALLQA